MFEHILIPLDGSALAECVLPHGLSMAKAFNSEVSLLQVLESDQPASPSRTVDMLEWRFRKAEAEAYLADVGKRLEAAGLRARTVLLEGQAAEHVIDYAQANRCGLILLSSHGRSGLSGWNVSSVVLKILLRARMSTMIIRAYQPVTADLAGLSYRRLLVPLDGSQRAECVLPPVTALAQSHGAVLMLAHVVHRPEMPRRSPLAKEDLALSDQITERNRLEAEEYLEELQTRLPLQVETRLLVSDHVADTLQQLEVEQNADLVVLSAHGYSGRTRWPYGSLAISFIAYGSTPLLIVQDLPCDAIEPSHAEMAAKEHRGH
jgi:nucleotide-binding universal stress UspA family protein